MCAVHASCLLRWYAARGSPADLRCPTCERPYTNEAGLLLSRTLVAKRAKEDRSRKAARAPETPQALLSRKHAAVTEATTAVAAARFARRDRASSPPMRGRVCDVEPSSKKRNVFAFDSLRALSRK